MKVLLGLATLFGLVVVTPIWYYLMYKILQGVNASDLMWFLYWVYVPVAFVVAGMQAIIKYDKDSQ